MSIPLRLLIVEDSERDVKLEVRTLEAAGYTVKTVKAETADEMKTALVDQPFDIVIADYDLPQFNAHGALAILQEGDWDIPCIIVSGAIGEETAVTLIKDGAYDYVMKDRLSHLPPAVTNALKDATNRLERKKANDNLKFVNTILTTQNETSLDAILVVDDLGMMISYNKNFVDLWGVPSDVLETRSDKMALQSVIDKIADADEFLNVAKHLHKNRQEKSHDEIKLKDGRILDRYSSPMLGADQHYYGRVWYFRDITDKKQAEEDLIKSYQSLKKALTDSINTIVKIVEMRDPYTSGHQQNVADLAVAIAIQMKSDKINLDDLKSAAIIHDIGKIHIPSDILSKPGRLSEIEFDLIKTHAQSGYDIVKEMNFPCSVATAVLQHHERLDGSGYPNQLKGEEIINEARILAVADVVEAMSSHRPYRPALGIDVALEEISRNRGRLYDPAVVDACVELFRSGRFELKPV